MRGSQCPKKYFQIKLLLTVNYPLCRPPWAMVNNLYGVPKVNLNRGKNVSKTQLEVMDFTFVSDIDLVFAIS